MLLLAITIFIIISWATFDMALGSRKLGSLSDVEALSSSGRQIPKVSIIVPACNEADTIAPALATLLEQEYSNLEIIVVNDRSSDDTGKILHDIQQQHPQLIILDIQHLPEGWLGKNHALQQGATAASGDIFLFTDADIHLEASTVTRAVQHLTANHLDHLSLIFKNKAKGWLLNGLILDAGAGLFLLFKPWLAKAPSSKRFMGVGAFNMIRRPAYEQLAGHGSIKMHPIDDIMLGKIVKEARLRQDCLNGYDFVTVNWYASTTAMIDGLMKNIFALYNFNTALALAGTLGIMLLTILPQWAIFFSTGLSQLIFALIIIIRLAFFCLAARHAGLSSWLAPAALLTPYITAYTIIKATFTTLKNNGITWRGTHYSLELLRTNRPLL